MPSDVRKGSAFPISVYYLEEATPLLLSISKCVWEIVCMRRSLKIKLITRRKGGAFPHIRRQSRRPAKADTSGHRRETLIQRLDQLINMVPG
jgi:hypothetical protein